jgi:hypothetical protein
MGQSDWLPMMMPTTAFPLLIVDAASGSKESGGLQERGAHYKGEFTA